MLAQRRPCHGAVVAERVRCNGGRRRGAHHESVLPLSLGVFVQVSGLDRESSLHTRSSVRETRAYHPRLWAARDGRIDVELEWRTKGVGGRVVETRGRHDRVRDRRRRIEELARGVRLHLPVLQRDGIHVPCRRRQRGAGLGRGLHVVWGARVRVAGVNASPVVDNPGPINVHDEAVLVDGMERVDLRELCLEVSLPPHRDIVIAGARLFCGAEGDKLLSPVEINLLGHRGVSRLSHEPHVVEPFRDQAARLRALDGNSVVAALRGQMRSGVGAWRVNQGLWAHANVRVRAVNRDNVAVLIKIAKVGVLVARGDGKRRLDADRCCREALAAHRAGPRLRARGLDIHDQVVVGHSNGGEEPGGGNGRSISSATRGGCHLSAP